MVVNKAGKQDVASCCDLFYPDGTMCSDVPEKCGKDAKICKAFGQADCDLCAAKCIEFYEDEPKSSMFRPKFINE